MADKIEEFFREQVDRGHQPLLGKVKGTVQIDLVDGPGGAEHWLVGIDRGDVTVSHAEGSADCTIRTDRALFERLVQGRENAMAAMLRGAMVCSGDVELLLAIQRIFPGPPNQRPAAGQHRGAQ
jgi:predicted lipid carrier protein YhbT